MTLEFWCENLVNGWQETSDKTILMLWEFVDAMNGDS